MKHATTKLIIQHLEYCGFTVEDTSGKGDTYDHLTATHPHSPNLQVYNNENEIIFLRASFGLYPAECIGAMTMEANKINASTILTKWRTCSDEDSGKTLIGIAACQCGYEKRSFAAMLDLFQAECRNNLPSFQQFTEQNKALVWKSAPAENKAE